MFENVIDAIDYVEGFDIYTDMSLQNTKKMNFTGEDYYLKEDNRKAVFEITYKDKAQANFTIMEDGNLKIISFEFYYIFSFVIDRQNLYVGNKIISLKNLRDICIDY